MPKPWRPSRTLRRPTPPHTVSKVDFDAIQAIKFRADRALWPTGPGACPVRLFHVDRFNPLGVRINELANGQARELLYSPDCFDYKDAALAGTLPPNLGFSGFRVMDGRGKETDWLAFQGASYFRTSGEDNQYGASARGIAINTAMPEPEEFPRFVEFWLEEPTTDAPSITIYALLDGPSISGAYRFEAVKGRGAIIDVSADLYARTDIDRVGIAPLTSMFWYGENDRRYATDWRPEIHDSDGLAMWTGVGEHIWRPLNNGPMVRTNTFSDASPKGFGLMQRDREFAEYQDDGAFYNKRPGIWVEPNGDVGRRRRAARRDPDQGRDERQHRRLLGAEEAGACRRRAGLRLQALLAERRAAPAGQHRASGVDAIAVLAAFPAFPIPTTTTSASSSSILPAVRWRAWSSAST